MHFESCNSQGAEPILLLNKADLLTREQRIKWAEYFDNEGLICY